jgi:hypothetical protein
MAILTLPTVRDARYEPPFRVSMSSGRLDEDNRREREFGDIGGKGITGLGLYMLGESSGERCSSERSAAIGRSWRFI